MKKRGSQPSRHPFREGNGRTQMSFLVALADRAGHRLPLEDLDPKAMLRATITNDAVRGSTRDRASHYRSRDCCQARSPTATADTLCVSSFSVNNGHLAVYTPVEA
jgi:hypothetical protein